MACGVFTSPDTLSPSPCGGDDPGLDGYISLPPVAHWLETKRLIRAHHANFVKYAIRNVIVRNGYAAVARAIEKPPNAKRRSIEVFYVQKFIPHSVTDQKSTEITLTRDGGIFPRQGAKCVLFDSANQFPGLVIDVGIDENSIVAQCYRHWMALAHSEWNKRFAVVRSGQQAIVADDHQERTWLALPWAHSVWSWFVSSNERSRYLDLWWG